MYNRINFGRYLYQHCHCCNAGQSKEERKSKYRLARYFGKGCIDSQKLRDWNKNPFAKWFGYSSWDNMIEILQIEVRG